MEAKGNYAETQAYFDTAQVWARINPDTGEVIGEPEEVNVLVKKMRRAGFAITYLSELVRLIDSIGNKKMQVIRYILENMDTTNKLTETTDEIARHSGVSRAVVSRTLTILEEVGFIARKRGVIMLSPKIAHKGNAKKEHFLLTRFQEIQYPD